ncbi:MAG: alpha/beta fold hydrolase [Isosphaeraceae bacterium]
MASSHPPSLNLYLHGFGRTNPRACPVAEALRTAVPIVRLHAPCYHPGALIKATRIGASLEEFTNIIVHDSTTGKVHLVGYSFGGLLGAILAARRPDIIGNVLLLAPAIDNYARNYERRDPASWCMPRRYVEELRAYPARPDIVRPTTLVHGKLDIDHDGSAPWRVRRWKEEQPFRHVYFLDGVDHSLEPWLSAPARTNDTPRDVPSFEQLVMELTSDE